MGVIMHNLGTESGICDIQPVRISYPSITITEDQLSAIKKYKVDDKVEFIVKGVIKEVRRSNWNNKKLQSVVDITAIGIIKDKTANDYLNSERIKAKG